jgi:5-methylcytosine-specific restriction endonuclease McrA
MHVRDETIEFATALLDLVHGASTTTSYKYALLMALIEISAENEIGEASLPITTRQIAARTLELYWPQARAFHEDVHLAQLGGSKRSIVDHIASYRRSLVPQPSSAQLAQRQDPPGYAKLLDEVEWLMIRNPIPVLQRLGRESLPLLYEPRWSSKQSEGPVRAYQARRASDFDNRVTLLPGVAAKLALLGPLFLPLIRTEWTRFVAHRNRHRIADARLESFLFEPDREQFGRGLGQDLLELQANRCFYCQEPASQRIEVDHFLAWSRCGASAIDNLVVAHDACNNNKSDLLVAARHLDRWIDRLDTRRADLCEIAERRHWYAEPGRIGSLIRANYAAVSPRTMLWLSRDRWVSAADEPLDHSRLALTQLLGGLAAATSG